MKRKRQRRAGATETFSISVDRETKQALRALADSDFGGNLSAVITSFAGQARRRLAAARYLKRHGIPRLTPEELVRLEEEIAREVRQAKRRKRRAA